MEFDDDLLGPIQAAFASPSDDDLIGPVRMAFDDDESVRRRTSEQRSQRISAIAARMADDIYAGKFPTKSGKPINTEWREPGYDRPVDFARDADKPFVRVPDPNAVSVDHFINNQIGIGDVARSYEQQYGEAFDDVAFRRELTSRIAARTQTDAVERAKRDLGTTAAAQTALGTIPFVNMAATATSKERLNEANERMKEGRATRRDYEYLALAGGLQEKEMEKGVGRRFAEGVASLPATIAEYVMSGGAWRHAIQFGATRAATDLAAGDDPSAVAKQFGQGALTDAAFQITGGFPGLHGATGVRGAAIGTAKGYGASQVAHEIGQGFGLNEHGGLVSALIHGDRRAIEDNLIELGVFATAEGASVGVKPLLRRFQESIQQGRDRKWAAEDAASAMQEVEFRRQMSEEAGLEYPAPLPWAKEVNEGQRMYEGDHPLAQSAREIMDKLTPAEKSEYEDVHQQWYQELKRGGMSDAEAKSQVQRDFLSGVQAADEAVAKTKRKRTAPTRPAPVKTIPVTNEQPTPPDRTPDGSGRTARQPDAVSTPARQPDAVERPATNERDKDITIEDVAAKPATAKPPEPPKVYVEPEPPPDPRGETPHETLARDIADHLNSGQRLDANLLFQLADQRYGGTRAEGKYGQSDAYDAMETGINMYLRGRTDPTADKAGARLDVERMEALKREFPTQTNRTGEKDKMQQFSTPPDYAYAAAWLANIRPGEVALEPSAGTGSLAVHMMNAGAEVHANELSARRAVLLGHIGTKSVTNENAEQINNILGNRLRPSVVVMNPPFSATHRMEGSKSSEVGQSHVDQALKILAPGGRLVAIVGGSKDRRTGEDTKTHQAWLNRLKQEYDVKADVVVKGDDVYRKYGTAFDSRVLVIDKSGPTKPSISVRTAAIVPTRGGVRAEPISEEQVQGTITGEVSGISELIDKLEGVRNERSSPTKVEQPTVESESRVPDAEVRDQSRPELPALPESRPTLPSESGRGELETPTVRSDPSPRDPSASAGERRPRRGGAAVGERPRASGEGSPTLGPEGVGGTTPATDRPDVGQGTGREPSGPVAYAEPRGELGGDRGPGAVRPSAGAAEVLAANQSVAVSPTAKSRQREVKDVLFDEYHSSISVPGSKKHPASLVESAPLASIDPPPITRKLAIDKKVIESGDLSDAQLDAIATVGAMNDQYLPAAHGTTPIRAGALVGDGTGVGKGREIAGVIMDNWNRGRKKALIVTKNDELAAAVGGHFKGAGGDPAKVFMFGKLREGKVPADEGVVVVKYDTLKDSSGTRPNLDVVSEWLGNGFDGVIAFDEAHLMGNALASQDGARKTEASQRAIAGLRLQDRFPDARVSYYSGTAATEPKGLGFASRLGLWGFGTPFAKAADFVNVIKGTGVAAMEFVSRDLKAMGRFLARNIAYNDGTERGTVQFERVSHKLEDYQVESYNKLAEGWRWIDANIQRWMDETNMPARDRGQFRGRFNGQRQDFFNQVITGMMVSKVISEIEKDPTRSHVIQLTRTMKAEMDRAVKKAKLEGTSLDEISISPREVMINFITKAFPTKMYETYKDERGNRASRPVVDSQGNPVENPEAVRARERMLKEIESTADLAPEGALDKLIAHFGTDKVAEVTGRSDRAIWVEQSDGTMKRMIEKRGKAANAKETLAFMDGRKKILIFSEGGGTGKDYHASLFAKNQEQRVHHLLQAGWQADVCMQGLGRTHRSNQAWAPIYKLYEAADLPGHKRFISTIARRLASLGALSRGDRAAASAGMFKASDDLSTDHALHAMRGLHMTGRAGRLEGIDRLQWSELGMDAKDEPTMENFLNGLLSVSPSSQQRIWNHFETGHADAIHKATINGTLDKGTQNFKASSIAKEYEETISKHNTGTETKYVRFNVKQPQQIVPFENAAKIPEFIAFARQAKSGRIVAVRDWTPVDRGGYEVRRVFLQTINGGDAIDADDFRGKYEKITDMDQARQMWNDQIAALPKFKESKLHFITGTVLPVFDRLGDHLSDVRRFKSDDGEVFLGAAIPPSKIQELLSKFQRTTGPQITPAHAVDAVRAGATAIVRNGWKLKRSMVQGEQRLELIGPSITHNPLIRGAGGMIEKINHKDRYFIPEGDGAHRVLDAINGSHAISMAGAEGTHHGPDDVYERTQSGNPDPRTLTSLASQFWEDNSGIFNASRAMEIVSNATQSLRDGLKELAGQSTPRTARLDEASADRMNEYAAAKSFVKEATPYFIDKVLAGATEEQSLKWGNTLYELRSRFARFVFDREGDTDKANAVPSFVGPDFPIKSEAEFQHMANSAEFRAFVDRWKREFLPVQERNFRKATGLDDADPIHERTQLPFLAFNMKAVREGDTATPGTVRMPGAAGNLNRPRMTRLGFSKEATFGADAYDMDVRSLIANTLERGTELARKMDMYNTLKDAGLAVSSRPGRPVMLDGQPAIEMKNTEHKHDGQRMTLFVDPRIYGELRKALNVDEPTKIPGLTPLAQGVTKVALLSTVEAAYHSKNLLTMWTKPGYRPADFIKNAVKVMKGDMDTRRSMMELASINAMKPHGADFGGEGSRWNPLSWTGKFLDVIDRTMRLTAKDAFERLAKQGRVERTERNLRDFVNQLGQYNRQTQHSLVRVLRDTGIGPFATAGTNFYMQGMRGMAMSPGATASSNAHAIGLRAEVLARTAAILGTAALSNYLLWGRVDGDENTPYGSIKLGDNGRGRTSYFNMADIMSPVPRGLRQIGAVAFVDGLKSGKSAAELKHRVADTAVHALLHPGIGPVTQSAYMAATGKDTFGRQIARREPGQRHSSPEANVMAMLKNLNPSIATGFGWNLPEYRRETVGQRSQRFLEPYVKQREKRK